MKETSINKKLTKYNGEVFTPKNIVLEILLKLNYYKFCLNKHIIDNSAGNGRFLIEVIDQYCAKYFAINKNKEKLINELEKYIHAIEINENNYNNLIINCNNVALKYGLCNIQWDFVLGDALKISKYNNEMDFVVGNPPYVRIHNVKIHQREIIKNMSFCKKSVSDMYIAFFNIGINMLNENGKLAYITPSSYFYSLSGKIFKNYILENNLLTYIKDFEHDKIFQGITTYSAITILDKSNKNKYFLYSNNSNKTKKLDYHSNFLSNDIRKMKRTNNSVIVKNGLATLNDQIFIIDKANRNHSLINNKHVIDAIKISSNKKIKIIFPYDDKGNVVPWDKFDDDLKLYLLKNKKYLDNSCKNVWYEYGRTQGIKDKTKFKIAVSNLISKNNFCYVSGIENNNVIVSGFYMIGELNKINNFLKNKNHFFNYVKNLKKYKNGFYYTFNSKDLEYYINNND